MKRLSQKMPKKVFYGDDVIDDVTGCHQSFSLYSCLVEVGSGSNCKGNLSINANIIIVFLGYTYQKTQWITHFEIASQRSTSQAYWVTLALISNIANYLKCNYFWDCDGILNVTLCLWKFSDFCSRHCRRRGWWYHVPHSSFALYLIWLLHKFDPWILKQEDTIL